MAEMKTMERTEVGISGRTLSVFLPFLVVVAALAIGWMALFQPRTGDVTGPSLGTAEVSEGTTLDVGGISEFPRGDSAEPGFAAALSVVERKPIESDYSYDADRDLENYGDGGGSPALARAKALEAPTKEIVSEQPAIERKPIVSDFSYDADNDRHNIGLA